MKKVIISAVLIAGLLMHPGEATSIKINRPTQKYFIETRTSVVLDALTIYNPVTKQCDRTPLVTANNSKIDIGKLQKQQLRWMALSRDLLKKWKGKFHYGDTVLITSGDSDIDGYWIIKDTMNKRYKNHGDLLFDSNVRTMGKWKHVEVTRVESITVYPKNDS